MKRIHILEYDTQIELVSFNLGTTENALNRLPSIQSVAARQLLSAIIRTNHIPDEGENPHLYALLDNDRRAKLVKWSSFKSFGEIQRLLLYIK